MFDLAIVGAGPVGLAASIEAKRLGLNAVVLEKGCVVNAIFEYPTYMTFFTSAELLEIGGHPLVSLREKPDRKEALAYTAWSPHARIWTCGNSRKSPQFILHPPESRSRFAKNLARWA